jgi:hypothetical protein
MPNGAAIRARFDRIVRLAALALAALASLYAPSLAQQSKPPRIVAVGDLHGDYDVWLAIARDAGLIDEANRWAGGNTTLVQLGDITDRGADSLKIIRSLQQLQREAPGAGGRVVVLLGNHEAMNVLGDLRYVSPGEFAAFVDPRSPARRERLYMASRQKLEAAAKATNPRILPSQVREQWLARTPLGWAEHRQAWSPSGELGRWAARNPAIVKIGDTVFVHGGLSAEYAILGIDEINRRAAAAMARADASPNGILSDPLGPLWYRGLVTRDPRVDPDGAACRSSRSWRRSSPQPARSASSSATRPRAPGSSSSMRDGWCAPTAAMRATTAGSPVGSKSWATGSPRIRCSGRRAEKGKQR